MKIGFYVGSFRPFHIGHLNIALQAAAIFDKVIIGPGINTDKTDKLEFEISDNVKKIFDIQPFSFLLTDAIECVENVYNTGDVTLVRGLRNGFDLAKEQNYIKFLKSMDPSIKVVFFVCDGKYEHISSTALRELKKLNFEEYKKYIP